MTSTTLGSVRAVLTGTAAPLGPAGIPSGIAKQAVSGLCAVSATGLAGDTQADTRVHGGPDKAVHCYAFAHYTTWRAQIGDKPVLATPGAFGENLSVDGCNERDICLGDQLRIGTALFEVSQGRQPCFKLNLRFDVPDMSHRVQDTLRTGWYLRVLQDGNVRTGDTLELLARPHPSYTIHYLMRLIRDGVTTPDILDPVLALPLPENWHRLFERRRREQLVEDWSHRLDGSA